MNWLTARGAAAAVAVGVATIYGFGWRGMTLLLAFFISSSLLTAAAGGGEKSRGGGPRNARQVVANGGVAALAALAGNWAWFAGAIAAANADTWATEIGSHSRTPPRLITTGRPVPAGTDGGMTVLGTAAGIAGAGFVAAIAYILGQRRAPAIAVAGVLGMIVDSLLGATVQGTIRSIDNNAVNLAATLTGAVCAGLMA
ncbi:MAG TPA: DUF92 domain-containing protein [Gemmatimonadales bacterium]|nr:DUF92 domain-containing protein [Gemmatimonadales bacterium]